MQTYKEYEMFSWKLISIKLHPLLVKTFLTLAQKWSFYWDEASLE
jgi:hypothetical protein